MNSKNNENELLKEVLGRLDILIRFKLEDKELSKREQIKILNSFGIKNKEIAKILNCSESYISSELTQIRKKREGDKNR